MRRANDAVKQLRLAEQCRATTMAIHRRCRAASISVMDSFEDTNCIDRQPKDSSTRFSVPRQAADNSLERQDNYARQWAEIHGLSLDEILSPGTQVLALSGHLLCATIHRLLKASSGQVRQPNRLNLGFLMRP